LDGLHRDGLKAGELVEDVEKLANAEVLLHLRLSYKLYIT
jgi:hypothetical protein